MRMRTLASTICRLAAVVLLAPPMLDSQVLKLTRGQSVYVVAVRNLGDGGLLRECLSSRLESMPVVFPAPELIPSAPGSLQGGVPDDAIRTRVEKEFQKQNKYKLAASPDAADLVFFVYVHFGSILMGTTQQGMYILGSDDTPPNLLQLAVALVVPAGIYRESTTDIANLVKYRLWESKVASVNDTPASPERLVILFSKGEQVHERIAFYSGEWNNPRNKPPANLNYAICARTQPRLAVMPAEFKPTGPSPAAEAAGQQRDAASDARFRVDVTLVTVPVVVTDKDGRNIPDLTQADFRIFEDNVEQKIDSVVPESEPFNVALMLDTSGSMGLEFEQIKKAAATFVEALRPEDRVMILSFGGRVYLNCEFTADHNRLLDALIRLPRGSRTRLYDALELAMTERLDLVQGRKAIVLFTDGVDTASGFADATGTLRRMGESSVPVYVIQYDTQKLKARPQPQGMILSGDQKGFFDQSAMYALAGQYLKDLNILSGGRLEHAESIGNLNAAFARIAGELRAQYAICYYPANQARDGSYRYIRVETNRPGVTVKARAAYRMSLKK